MEAANTIWMESYISSDEAADPISMGSYISTKEVANLILMGSNISTIEAADPISMRFYTTTKEGVMHMWSYNECSAQNKIIKLTGASLGVYATAKT